MPALHRGERLRSTIGRIARKLIGGICLILGAYYLWFSFLAGFQIMVFLSALLFLGMGVVDWLDLIPLVRLWFWSKRNDQTEPEQIELVFNESSASYTSATASVRLNWEKIKRVLESDQTFLLVLASQQYWTVPKRLFADASAMGGFRELLARKVGVIG
jgi:hypothetical protein